MIVLSIYLYFIVLCLYYVHFIYSIYTVWAGLPVAYIGGGLGVHLTPKIKVCVYRIIINNYILSRLLIQVPPLQSSIIKSYVRHRGLYSCNISCKIYYFLFNNKLIFFYEKSVIIVLVHNRHILTYSNIKIIIQ